MARSEKCGAGEVSHIGPESGVEYEALRRENEARLAKETGRKPIISAGGQIVAEAILWGVDRIAEGLLPSDPQWGPFKQGEEHE